MRFRSSGLRLALLLCLFQLTASAQEPEKYKELPNFHRVNERLFRGGQPKSGGLKKLKQLGVKTIVDLRQDDTGKEKAEAKASGFEYFNFPMERMGRPDDETVQQVLQIITEVGNQPVFVHCAKGADRTGTIIAIYRIEHDGWTSEKAKAEAKNYGMAIWQVQMKNYIREYFERHSAKVNPPK